MVDVRMIVQVGKTISVIAEPAGVEHCLCRLRVDQLREFFQEPIELGGTEGDHQSRLGAELPGALGDGCTQFGCHLATAGFKRLRQQQYRVDAGHFGEHRNRFGSRRRHITQCPTAFERAGEADRLDGRMLHQPGTDGASVNHVEDAERHVRLFGSPEDGQGNPFSGGHVAAVCLEHHRATCRQRGSGISAGSGEGQREITGAEDRDRADADMVLTQVGTRLGLAIGQGAVDACAEEITASEHLGEQSHLAAGTGAFTLNSRHGQCCFAADRGDERFSQRVEFIGNGVKKVGASTRRKGAVRLVSTGRGPSGRVHFLLCRLDENTRQLFARVGVETVQARVSLGAACAVDEVVSGASVHENSRND